LETAMITAATASTTRAIPATTSEETATEPSGGGRRGPLRHLPSAMIRDHLRRYGALDRRAT
jgi:hypothetical protein